MEEKDLLKLADLIVEKLRQCPIQVIVNIPQPHVVYVPQSPEPWNPCRPPNVTWETTTVRYPGHSTC